MHFKNEQCHFHKANHTCFLRSFDSTFSLVVDLKIAAVEMRVEVAT